MAWYSLEPALSRGADMILGIGDRGKGKTFACKQYAFKDWKKNGNQWVYVRRGADELNACKHNLWDDLLPDEGYETKSKGHRSWIRLIKPDYLEGAELKQWEAENPWEIWGYYISIGEQQNFKSATFPLVTKIIFDEFILENQRRRYIPDEVNQFLGLVSTIFRERKGKVLCMSNAGFIANPYFQYYGVNSGEFESTSFVRRHGGKVLFEYIKSDPTEAAERNQIVSGIANDEYKDYALHSKFKDGGEGMLDDKPAGSHPWIRLTKDGKKWLTIYSKPGTGWWVGAGNSNCNAYSADKWKPMDGIPYDQKLIASLKSGLNMRVISFADADVRATFLMWVRGT